MAMQLHPPPYQCEDQEQLLAALLSPKQPLSTLALEPAVSAAIVAYETIPFDLRALMGKLCLNWLGWNGTECHCYMVLDALTCSGCDRHNQGIYVLLLRLLPVLRQTLHLMAATPARASR